MDSSRILMSLLSLVHTGGASSTSHLISDDVLRHLLTAIHYRDARTMAHARRVGILAVGIASRLGWEPHEVEALELAALLHDLGKVGVPDHILHKPGKLSLDEAEYIAVHHRVAIALLQACRVHPQIIEIIMESHGLHEQDGCPGTSAAGLGARILAVADAYDSLTTPQPYRVAFDRQKAFSLLDEQAGKQFDRNVVAALGRWLEVADVRLEETPFPIGEFNNPHMQIHAGNLCQVVQYLYTLESLYDAFYLIDRDYNVLVCNNGASQLFGLSAGSRFDFPPDPRKGSSSSRHLSSISDSFASGQSRCHEIAIADADGNQRVFDVQTIPIIHHDGGVAAVVESLSDKHSSKHNAGQFRQLQMAASRDALTGVFNRGQLEEAYRQLFDNWQNNPDATFSVLFFDLDHFKAINDRLSHSVGDRVLVEVARLVQDELYSGETIGRYGGEEFVVLCPETSLNSACERAERLRRTITSSNIADRDDLRVTASFGVAEAEPGDTADELLKRADEALYDAKRNGRNRTCRRTKRKRTKSIRKTPRQNTLWIHSVEIRVCVAADMLPFKLRGFVDEHSAQLIKVTTDSVVLTVGTFNIFGGWGRSDDRQPVQVTLDIQAPPTNNGFSVTQRICLKTIIEPIGRPDNFDVFKTRAARVVEKLRSYLMAD